MEFVTLVERFVARRLERQERADVVQSVFEAALAAERSPDDVEELRRWLVGIARNKVVDVLRQRRREQVTDLGQLAPHAHARDTVADRDLVRWAEEAAHSVSPDAGSTLRWIAREGGGEKLEQIAGEAGLPATVVRKRVSRLRAAIRKRWALELTGAAIVVALLLVVSALLRRGQTPKVDAEQEPTMKRLHSVGDDLKRIPDARKGARDKLAPRPSAKPTPSAVRPSPSGASQPSAVSPSPSASAVEPAR